MKRSTSGAGSSISGNPFSWAWGTLDSNLIVVVYRKPNNDIYKIVVVVWITLSVAGVILSAVTWLDLWRKIESSAVTVALREEVDAILRLMIDSETGQRGYTITGDETFLAPLTRAELSLPEHFSRLVDLSREEPNLLKRTIELRAQAEVELEENRKIVAARRTEGARAAAKLVESGEGKRNMDAIRASVDEIRRMRSDFAAEGSSARARLVRASLTSLVAAALGVGAGLIALWLARVMLRQQLREKELIEARLQAERSSEEKTVFLANMSHEIRTPMNAILGFTELLQSELADGRPRQYLQAIRTSAASLLQLINDILDMSKIEAGVMELREESTDPREICDFLHAVFSEPAAKKGVKLECRVAEDLPPALLLDRIRLRQILVNLVGNAVKFTDAGNIYVRVQWEKEETSSRVTLLIEVQDTGVGIPADRLEAIFKPFVQAGAHREKEKSGTGLGLSIVQRLTEIMGGKVTAASVPGKGSGFSLRFPHVAISARLPVGDKLEALGPIDFNELRPSTILVVDDNETNCRLVEGMFVGSHHKLIFASNGLEAVERARLLHPDVILMDLRMPGMDGRKALAEVRKVEGMELTPILAVTASTLMTEEQELKIRFSGYVRKPFSRRELFDELAQFLPRHNPEKSQAAPGDGGALAGPPAPEIIAAVRKILAEDWPGLRESLAFRESRQLAERLQQLAERWNSPAISAYAHALNRHAENYSVVDLELHLAELPLLVDRLEKGFKQ